MFLESLIGDLVKGVAKKNLNATDKHYYVDGHITQEGLLMGSDQLSYKIGLFKDSEIALNNIRQYMIKHQVFDNDEYQGYYRASVLLNNYLKQLK
ncbi:hypothetical protein HSE3_gp037 [Bacillus phage vB_BceM-HSE3]|nr:hypothetical protein HSE3_gp037 [Bacillus phage vB_BceM-HSE3]